MSDNTPLPVPLLGPEELSELIGVPVSTLYAWRYRGLGPRSIRVGRHIRYHPDDVAEWIEAQRTKETRTS